MRSVCIFYALGINFCVFWCFLSDFLSYLCGAMNEWMNNVGHVNKCYIKLNAKSASFSWTARTVWCSYCMCCVFQSFTYLRKTILCSKCPCDPEVVLLRYLANQYNLTWKSFVIRNLYLLLLWNMYLLYFCAAFCALLLWYHFLWFNTISIQYWQNTATSISIK